MCRIMIALAQISSIMIILVGSIGAIKSLILHASVGQFMIVRYVSELVAGAYYYAGYDEGWKIIRKEKV